MSDTIEQRKAHRTRKKEPLRAEDSAQQDLPSDDPATAIMNPQSENGTDVVIVYCRDSIIAMYNEWATRSRGTGGEVNPI